MLSKKKIVGIAVALLLISLVIVFAAKRVYITCTGSIKTVGVEVYADDALTQSLNNITWGIVSPGDNATFPAWIKNAGNTPITLQMWTEAWTPENASTWITLTWNYTNASIPARTAIPVVFTLSVDANVSGIVDFSFDIWIEGVK